jgi:hypothetical protein
LHGIYTASATGVLIYDYHVDAFKILLG